MKYTQIHALTGLTYCRELVTELDLWAKALACEEPEAAQRSFELIEKVNAFLERMNQDGHE
jgi:hypothetical protein